MRTNLLAALALLGLISVGSATMPSMGHKHVAANRDINKNHFGNVEVTEIFDSDENSPVKVLKTVHLSNKEFVRDYERQTRAL